MRNRYIILALTLLICGTTGVYAQSRNDRRTVRVKDFELVQSSEGQVAVDFTLVIGSRAAARGNTLSIIPVLKRGGLSRELTPVVIRGRRAKILYERRFIASPQTAARDGSEAITADNGQSLKYHIVIPFEDWMAGSALSLEGVDEGCCSATRTDMGLIAENLMVIPGEVVVEEKIAIPQRVFTTAEKLAERFPFVKPSGSDEARSRDGITVYFHQGRHDIDQNYRMNHQSLIDILSVVREIERSGDSEVERIVIAGFASPEGSWEHNMRLSERRGEAVRKFIFDNTSIRADRLSVHAGGEDWDGLRELVAGSDMWDKQMVLDIIDRYPVWGPEGGRESKLMRLRGGETYRYMYRNFFPNLREAAYIMVYYKDK